MLLFEPLKIKSLELPNRWVMSPMCMYSAVDGCANDFHFTHYASRSQGGVGLIIVEATGITPEARITPGCLGLWNDKQSELLQKTVRFVHQYSKTKIGIQLNHSGRKGSTWKTGQIDESEGGWQTVAPSPIAYQPGERAPKELSVDEIKSLIESFAAAAQRAVDTGFDLIEIHAAHGYLIHQFLSPQSNKRTDAYGGSFENNIRFLLEIIDAVNQVIPAGMPLLLRISATEYANIAGWNLDDSIKLAELVKERNVDLIDVSSGGNIFDAGQSANNSSHVSFAETLKTKTGIMTSALGLINDAKTAEEILQKGEADLIFMGRELLRNPYLPVLTSFETNQECFFPHQYDRGKPDYK